MLAIGVQLAVPPMAFAQSGPQIVVDGNTQTNLDINGAVTDVTTGTISGNVGLNSFSIFDVYDGNVVNMHLPTGTDSLFNFVHDKQTSIDGILNGYKAGNIDGDVYFLNPHGVVIGESGAVNVGRLRMMTPTHDFMRNLFPAPGVINPTSFNQIVNNGVPLSRDGLISIRGTINAMRAARITGGDIDISGALNTGETARISASQLVNLGMDSVDLSSAPQITLSAQSDVSITGRVIADGHNNADAGDIDIRAGETITTGDGALVSASGQGTNSDGGNVIIFADETSTLMAGSQIRADGGVSGDGGFVEFSAIGTVELAGGTLSAAASNGVAGSVLIDPDNITISSDLLRDASSDGGTGDNNTSWNAGSLTLQATDTIRLGSSVTVSSRRVTNSSSASAHRNDNSIAASGDITLQSKNIVMENDSMITARGNNGFDGGVVTLDVDADTDASITLDGAAIYGKSIVLDANAARNPTTNYASYNSDVSAIITADNNSIIGDSTADNVTISAVALQGTPGISGGVVVNTDNRNAVAAVNLTGVSIVAANDIAVTSASTIQTDMSNSGWTQLGSLLPLSIGVAVTSSRSDLVLNGTSSIQSTGGAVSLASKATTQSTIFTQANSAGGALVAAISVTENNANLDVGGSASIEAAGDINVTSVGKSQITSVADASAASLGNLSGSLAIGVGIVRDNTTTDIMDNASIQSTGGGVLVGADSQVQTVFAGRAAFDDDFASTAQSKFDAAIDNRSELSQTFAGINLATTLKSGVSDVLTQFSSSMGGSGGGVQLAGSLIYADLVNDTNTIIGVADPALSASAPSLQAAGNLTIRSRGITHSQAFASGRTDNATYGGSAGVAIQKITNRMATTVSGSDLANVQLTGDNITIAALTEGYQDNISATNKFGVYAISGVGTSSSDSIGLSGALAIGISNTNEVTATLGDNTTTNATNDVDVNATNITDIKVKADGSKTAVEASGRFMAVLKDETPVDSVISTSKKSGKLGLGASVAVAVAENTARANIASGAIVTAGDNITVSAQQTGTTASEARAAGAGGLAIIPLAAVTVARNNASASIDAGVGAVQSTGAMNITSTQTVSSTAVGNGLAEASGQDNKVAIGMSAGLVIGFDNNSASLGRSVTAGGLSVLADTSHTAQSGAQSSAQVVEPEAVENVPATDNTSNSSTDDAVNGMMGMGNGFSGKTVNVNVVTDRLSTDTKNVTGGDTPLGGGGNSDDSTKVAVAGAFGVTYVESAATAEIGNNVTVAAGTNAINVASRKNTDITATGDASVAGGDYNIGGGLGLNIATASNNARVGSGASLVAGDLAVDAKMLSQLAADNSTDVTNTITSSATSGAGTGEVAVAGALALNVVIQNDTVATVESGAILDNVSGNIAIGAVATNTYDADSLATVGETAGLFSGIDAALGGLSDITVWTANVSAQFTDMLQKEINTAFSEADATSAADSSDDGGDDDEGGFGLGAGISLNVIVKDKTRAELADNVTINNTAQSLAVTSTATTKMKTNAVAGAKPGTGTDPDAKTSLDAAVAVGVLVKDVDAYIGSGASFAVSDNVTVTSVATTTSNSTAKGEVSATDTAVGASVAVGVVLEDNDAYLGRSLTSSAGGLNLRADSDSTDIVLADAVAAGTVLDEYTNKLGMSEADLLGNNGQTSGNKTPASMEALNGDFSGGKGAQFDTNNSSTDAGGKGGEGKKSGSINIAASVAVSWADHDATATVADGVSVATAKDITVAATNDVQYRTRGSGLAVFADNAIGVGVGILATSQNTNASIGNGTSLTTSAADADIEISAITSENQGNDPDNSSIPFGSYASAEAIAGAGGGDIGVAGSLALVYSDDEQQVNVGTGSVLSAQRNVVISSRATNKIVTRAWAAAVASSATCSDPGNCNSNGDRTAVGAGIAVNLVLDNNTATISENAQISGDNITIEARDLSPNNAAFTLDPSDNSTTTEDYITANYTANLQNSSYYAEAIAGAGAQDGNAIGGSLAFTMSLGKTQAVIGEGVALSATENIDIDAYNESDARHLVGALALSSGKKAVGASISGIYLREDVQVVIGAENGTDNGTATRIIANNSIDIDAKADQDTLTYMAAGGVSTNDVAAAGSFGFNVMDSDVDVTIIEDAVLQATTGSIGINADSMTNIRNFALAISGSGGGNSVGGSLALNLFLTDKKAVIGTSTSADNNISINAATNVNIGVDTKQEITNGIISASVSTSDNAISGALSSNTVKGESKALVRRGADINDNTTLNASAGASAQAVSVYANDNTTLTDLTGTIAASSSTSVGVALAANVLWKDVEASVDGAIIADGNVGITADTVQNLTATVVGIAASSGGTSGAGSVSFGLVKTTTAAAINGNANIDTDGSVKLHAGDDTDIFMLEPAASFTSGGTALAGAVGAAVFLGSTKAQIKDGAVVSARGQSTIDVDTTGVTTSSPLLDGISGGGDDETRDALGSFNDNFTFDNIKDLFLTETRTTETKRGVSVTATADQDVISIAASGAVSSDSAIAISLSAGVGVGTTEASIGNATINNDISAAHANQDVTVRAISDTYWVDLSAALGVGTGSAGVGVGGDVVVQVKNTDAFIANGATVKANQNVEVLASSKDKIINSAATLGIGSSAGVAGTAAVGVLVNTTNAYIEGTVTAEDNISVSSNGDTELIQIAGAVGGGGSAGIGASFGVAVVKGTNIAYIGDNATTNARGTTSVTADTDETSIAAVLAGGIGGSVGVSVSGGIKVHDSVTKAYIYGDVNQSYTSGNSDQDVVVTARNDVTTIDVTGGIGGGGAVGVGVTLNALVVHNKAQAWIGGGTSTAVSAERDVTVEAISAKSTKNFTLAGAAGGTVSVAGNVAVVLVGAQADEETDKQMTGSGNNLADDSDSRQNSLTTADIFNDDNSSGDYSRTGDDYATIGTEIDSRQSQTNIGSKFNNTGATTSLNQTKAYIANNAVVTSGRDVTVSAEDTTSSIYTGGALGGAGVVGVGVTVGVMIVNNTAEAFIGQNAQVNATRNTVVKARTSEDVTSAALSAGGAGITSVQGTVMAQVTRSTTRAYIADNASINQSDNGTTAQSVAVSADSATSQLSVSGSGGGALVGVGITGDTLVLEKETTAYIGDDARVRSGGDVSVDANAKADLLQIALSINGGLVGVTGAAGVTVASNTTSASIGNRAVVFAEDSIRVQATDDTEVDAIVITGSGGAVGVSGSVGVYTIKSSTSATIGDNATITALAEDAGGGMAVASGSVDNSTTTIVSKATRDRDNNTTTDNFTVVSASFDNQTTRGLSIAAVTYEDINFAPIGVAGGAVGVAGVVATTVSQSTTKASLGNGTTVNANNTGAGANQDVRLLAASETSLNNISAGIGGGAVGVTFDIDTQIFKKTVTAEMLGDATATNDVSVAAKSTNKVYQTASSIAVGGSAVGGIVAVSVIADDVKAEIGDNSTVIAGGDVAVDAQQNINMYQTLGNLAGGLTDGSGSSLGVLVARSSTTARIGDNANVTARDNLSVTARTDNSLNQNVVGFSGGMGTAISGSLGINVFKTSTTAEIGDNTQINQTAGYDDNASQSITVSAIETVSTQGAAGAAAVSGGAGVGIGLTATVTRNTVKARIGDNAVISARGNIDVLADSTKNISNQGIAFAGGGIAGAAGSVALSLIGGGMSDNASDTMTNDNGNMLDDVESQSTASRQQNDGSDNESAKANTRAYAGTYDNESNALAQSETAGLKNDVSGTGSDSTLAEIGANVTVVAGGDVSVRAEETINLSQVSGGAAVGAVGLGGFVAVADYNGSVAAKIGSNTSFDNITGLSVAAELNSGDDIVIDIGSDNITVKAVNTTVIGAAVGAVGLAASIARVNLAENAKATIGDNVTVSSANTPSIAVTAERDVDAEANVAAITAGLAAAGISYVGVNATGDALASIGKNSNFGTAANKTGAVTIRARNNSSQKTRAVSAGFAYAGALVGAFVDMDDTGTTEVLIDNGTKIYAGGALSVTAEDYTSNQGDAIGVAVAAGIGLSGVFTDLDVTRNARLTVGDNVTMTADSTTMQAIAGDGSTYTAKSNAVAASGGALAGANATYVDVDVDVDAAVQIGADLNFNDSGSSTITANNRIRSLGETTGISVGVVAIGANFADVNSTGDATISIGERAIITAGGALSINATSGQEVLTDTTAGGGGGLAAVGGEAKSTQVTNATVVLADGIADNASVLTAGDNLTIAARNTDKLDAKLDATAVGGVQVAAGKTIANGTSNVAVDIGNYDSLIGDNVTLTATNEMTKDGWTGNNFLIEGGGAISVSLGESTGTLVHTTDVTLGQHAKINLAGSLASPSKVQITALSIPTMDDQATVNVGGVVSVPQSSTIQTATATTRVSLEDNASISTSFGDVLIEAQTAPQLDVRARTSTYGLVGAGASAKAVANVTKSDNITLAGAANVKAGGNIGIYAGRIADINYRDHKIKTDSRIWNNTLIPIDTGRISTVTFTNDSTINIGTNASARATKDITLFSTRLELPENLRIGGNEYLNVSSYGEAKNVYQAAGEAITGGNYSDFYGSVTTDGAASVIADGTVETGIEKDVTITIDKDFNPYFIMDNGSTGTYLIAYDNESESPTNEWVLLDDAVIDSNLALVDDNRSDEQVSPLVRSLNDNISAGDATWEILPEEDFAANARAEVAALKAVREGYVSGFDNTTYVAPDNTSHAVVTTTESSQLIALRTNLDSRISELEALIPLYGSEPVPVLKLSGIEAATGDVIVYGDYLAGSGTLNSPAGETITITNNSPMSLQLEEMVIPDAAGGRVFMNGVEVANGSEIDALNTTLPSGVTQGLTLVAGGGSGAPVITVNNNWDTANASLNPLGFAGIANPSLVINGELRNIRGDINVTNLRGSVFQKASAVGANVSIASGGDYVFASTENFSNIGTHPLTTTALGTSAVSGELAAGGSSTISAINNGVFDGTGCSPHRTNLEDSYSYVGGSWVRNTSSSGGSCTGTAYALADHTNDSSYIAASENVFISANNVNINALVQSGVINKEITVSQAEVDTAIAGMAAGATTVLVKSGAKTMTGTANLNGDNRQITGDLDIYYDANADALYASGADVKGGNVVISGNLISTGNGRVVAVDGYGSINVTNNSTKQLLLTNMSTGGIEGKITLVDKLQNNGTVGTPLITEYTRVNSGSGETLIVKNNQGSATVSNVVSSTVGASSTSHGLKTGARYNFMTGQTTSDREINRKTHTSKKLWGVNAFDLGAINWAGTGSASGYPQSSALTGADLPQGDYIDIDTSETNDYTFYAETVETSRVLTASDYGLESCWWGGFLNMVRYCRYYQSQTYNVGSLTYNYHSLDADKPLSIGFIGEETGTVTVNSAGGIRISGQISNSGGETSLTASAGDILNTNLNDTIESGNLTLTATNGSIGTTDNPLRLLQGANDNLTITAGQDVNLSAPKGNLYVQDITVGGTGNINLFADQNINLMGANSVLTANSISLIAETGGLTADNGSFRVNTNAANGGTLTMVAGSGDLDVQETSGDLKVNRITTTGDITLDVVSGNLLDGNTEEVADTIAIADLNALVAEIGLSGAEAETKKARAISTYEQQVEALYQDYWRLRDIQQDSDGNWVATAYNPNFIYETTAAEEAALDNDAGKIATYKLTQQATYQSGYEKFGDPAYDSAYSYTITADESAAITAGYAWSDDQLNNNIPIIEFKEVTDTTLAIENANLTGANITVTTGAGSIGQMTDNFTVDLKSANNADYNLDALDNATRLALAAAESEDVSYDNATSVMTVRRFDDVDVWATGNVTMTSSDVIYLGSEQNTYIQRADATGDVRIKMDGDMINGRLDNLTVISGNNILLESGKGQIGSSSKAMTIDAAGEMLITARARDGMWIEEVSGDANIASLYSTSDIDFTSAGSIIDAANDSVMDVKGLAVNLTANGSIGLAPSDGDSDSAKKNKALDVGTTNDDNATFAVTSATGGAWLFTPLGEKMRLTGANLNGDLDMAVGSTLKVVGSLQTNGGSVTLRSFEDLNLEGDGGIDTNGAVLNLISGDNMEISGTVSTGGGGILATIGDNMTVMANTVINTGGGQMVIDADALADGLGYQNVTFNDGSTTDVGTGRFLVEASDTATITGVSSDNTTSDAVVIRANSIQDGGNANPDITLTANGDVKLQAHKYVNLNDITSTGGEALIVDLQGKIADNVTRAGAVMLGVNAASGVTFSRFLADNGGVNAFVSDRFEIVDGTVVDDMFISAGGFDARVGRLKSAGLAPNEWLGEAALTGFFADGALRLATRNEDYSITGPASYRGNNLAVLSYNFLFDNPNVSSSGIATSWSPIYELVGSEASLQRLEDRVALTLSAAIGSNRFAQNIDRQALTITRFNEAVAAANAPAPTTVTAEAPAQIPELGVGDQALEAVFSETFAVRDSGEGGNSETGVLRLGIPGFVNVGAAPADATTPSDDAQDNDADSEQAGEDDDLPDGTIPLAIGVDAVGTEQISQLAN